MLIDIIASLLVFSSRSQKSYKKTKAHKKKKARKKSGSKGRCEVCRHVTYIMIADIWRQLEEKWKVSFFRTSRHRFREHSGWEKKLATALRFRHAGLKKIFDSPRYKRFKKEVNEFARDLDANLPDGVRKLMQFNPVLSQKIKNSSCSCAPTPPEPQQDDGW